MAAGRPPSLMRAWRLPSVSDGVSAIQAGSVMEVGGVAPLAP